MSATGSSIAHGAGEYLDALTGLRGLLCLWVWFLHLGLFGLSYLAWDLPALFGALPVAVITQGYLAVDLFFILSGVVLMHVYRAGLPDWAARWRFWRARFARVYPLHLLVLLFVLMAVVSGLVPAAPVFPPPEAAWHPTEQGWAFARSLLLVQSWDWWPRATWSGMAWSISAEAFLYLLFPALLPLCRCLRSGLLALSGLLCWPLVLVLITGNANEPAVFVQDLAAAHPAVVPYLERLSPAAMEFGLLRGGCGFLTGCCAYGLWQSRLFVRLPWSSIGLLACGLLFGLLVWGPVLAVYPLLGLLVTSLLETRSILARVCAWRPFCWLGDRSYAVYLTHPFYLPVLMLVDGQRALLVWLMVALLTGLLLLGSHLVFRWFERPCRDWLRAS